MVAVVAGGHWVAIGFEETRDTSVHCVDFIWREEFDEFAGIDVSRCVVDRVSQFFGDGFAGEFPNDCAEFWIFVKANAMVDAPNVAVEPE